MSSSKLNHIDINGRISNDTLKNYTKLKLIIEILHVNQFVTNYYVFEHTHIFILITIITTKCFVS